MPFYSTTFPRMVLGTEPTTEDALQYRMLGGNTTPVAAGNGADFAHRGFYALHTVANPTGRMYVTKTQDNLATGTNANDLDDATPTTLSMDSFGTGAQGDYLYIGSTRPFMGLHVTVGNANGNANAMTVEVWTTSWQAVASLVDGTDTGPSLAQTGYVSWAQSSPASSWAKGKLTDIAAAAAAVPNATEELYWCRVSWSAAFSASVTITAMRIAEELAHHAADLVVVGWSYPRNTTAAKAAGVDYTAVVDSGGANRTHTSPLFYNGFNVTYDGTGTIDCESESVATFFTAQAAGIWNTDTGTIKRPAAFTVLSPNNAGTLQDNAGLDIMDQSSGGGGTYSGTGKYGATAGIVGAAIRIRKQTNTQLMSFVDSAVAHGMTDIAGTAEYGQIFEAAVGNGGINIRGLLDQGTVALQFQSIGVTDITGARSTGSLGYVRFQAYKKSGTSVTAPGADANLLVIQSGTSTRFAFDSDGDSHQDVGTAWTNFDDQEDWQMARGLVASIRPDGDPLRERHADLVERYKPILAKHRLISYNDDGHHFIAMRRTLMFTLDMGFQIGQRIWGENGLASEVAELRRQLAEANRKLELLAA